MRSATKTWLPIASTRGHQGGRAGAERRDIEFNAFLGVDLALPVERQEGSVLAEQDLGQQLWASAATGNGVRGRRRLGDGLAAPAGEPLAHVLDHLQLGRHMLQGLRDVLAELPQRTTAAGAC
jgi:hypothetical protein